MKGPPKEKGARLEAAPYPTRGKYQTRAHYRETLNQTRISVRPVRAGWQFGEVRRHG